MAADVKTPLDSNMDDERAHRRLGLRYVLVGGALFLPGLLLFMGARDWLLSTFGTVASDEATVRLPRAVGMVIGAPMAVGYVILMMGIYRVVFGSRGRKLTVAWSAFRILFGLVLTIGMIVVAFMVMAALR